MRRLLVLACLLLFPGSALAAPVCPLPGMAGHAISDSTLMHEAPDGESVGEHEGHHDGGHAGDDEGTASDCNALMVCGTGALAPPDFSGIPVPISVPAFSKIAPVLIQVSPVPSDPPPPRHP